MVKPELILKKADRGAYELFDGDKKIGLVSPVVYGARENPTGWYSYELPGFYPSGSSFINWRAGRTLKEAALKLAHKAGYK
jgi:hypothetical protein